MNFAVFNVKQANKQKRKKKNKPQKKRKRKSPEISVLPTEGDTVQFPNEMELTASRELLWSLCRSTLIWNSSSICPILILYSWLCCSYSLCNKIQNEANNYCIYTCDYPIIMDKVDIRISFLVLVFYRWSNWIVVDKRHLIALRIYFS